MKVYIYDELSEAIVTSVGEIDLTTGVIFNISYLSPHESFNNEEIFPCESLTYEGTTGEVNIEGKNIGISINTESNSYVVSQSQLDLLNKELSKISVNKNKMK